MHRMGLRFRVAVRPVKDVRRSADVVFTRAKVAVFLDGCFWHGCDEHFVLPRTNRPYWQDKIENNRHRDAETNALLAAAGWTVIRVWEHEDLDQAARAIADLVRAPVS